MSRTICLVFVCVITGGLANPATQEPCEEETPCEVSNVDITPCASKSRCVFKIGRNATINFDFVPQFAASELLTDVSWRGISFSGIENDACKFTSCPVSPGEKQSLSFNLNLRKKDVAKGVYDIKWKLWNKANENQLCCFFTKIKLT